MNEDSELLRRYAATSAEDAIGEFIRRNVSVVYPTALRRLGGDVHLAQDVTQMVFLAAARQADKLARHPEPTAWLFATTRNIAAATLRNEKRRRRRETQAMEDTVSTALGGQEAASDHPLLDESIAELRASDRQIILLRFYQGLRLAEIGTRLGITDNAAQKRVERALEHLRSRLARHGVTSTATALAVALQQQSAIALPAGLAAGVSTFVAASGSTGTTAAGVFALMSSNKTVLTFAGVIALLLVGAFVVGINRTEPGSDSSSFSEPFAKSGVASPSDESLAIRTVSSLAFGETAIPAAIVPWDFSEQIVAVREREAAMEGATPEQIFRSMQQRQLREASARAEIGLDAGTEVLLPAELATLEDPDAATAYFRTLDYETWRSTLRYLELATATPGAQRQMLAESLFQVWTETDPAGAMAAAGARWATTAIGVWARTSPVAAWSWAKTAGPDPFELTMLRQYIIRNLPSGQEEMAGTWIMELAAQLGPDSDVSESGLLVQAWIKRDPLAAGAWVNKYAQAYPENARNALAAIGRSVRDLSPELFDALMEQQNDANRDRILESAIDTWVDDDQLDRVKDYMLSHPELTDSRHDLILSTFGEAIEEDYPEIAFEAIQAIRDSNVRDQALSDVGRQTGFSRDQDGIMQPKLSPETGMQYALTIGNKELQALVVLENYYWWAKSDPTAARAFIEQEDFPADFRAGLLALGL